MCKVSIIIPVYNMAQYLNRTLKSVLAQTLIDIEVILIDDGSTDHSVEICKQFQAKDKRIQLFCKENGGQATARNMGLKHASGKYICFVDADDWIEKNYCQTLVSIVEPEELDIGVCNYCYKKDGETIKGYTVVAEDKIETLQNIDFKNEDYLYKYLFKVAGGSPANKIFRRAFLETNNIYFYHNRYAEDLIFNAICLQYCNGIGYTCATLYNYEVNIGSTTKMYRKKYFKEFITLVEKYEIKLKDSGLYERYYKNCAILVYSAVMNALSNAYKYGEDKSAQKETLKNIMSNTYSNEYINKIRTERILDKKYIPIKKKVFSNLLCYLIRCKATLVLDWFLSFAYKYIG